MMTFWNTKSSKPKKKSTTRSWEIQKTSGNRLSFPHSVIFSLPKKPTSIGFDSYPLISSKVSNKRSTACFFGALTVVTPKLHSSLQSCLKDPSQYFSFLFLSKSSYQTPQQATNSFQRCRPLSSVQIARLQPFQGGGGCFPAGAKTKARSGNAQRIPAHGEYTQTASQQEKRKRKTCLDSSFSEPERSKLQRGRAAPTT